MKENEWRGGKVRKRKKKRRNLRKNKMNKRLIQNDRNGSRGNLKEIQSE